MATCTLPDRVDPPHLAWWIAIPSLLGLLFLLGFSPRFHTWYATHLYDPGAPHVLRWVFLACIPIHFFEGAWAWRRARELGLHGSARWWALQSFVVGWPATKRLKQRADRRRELYEGARPLPGPVRWPVVGNSVPFARSPLEFLLRMHRAYGDVVRFRVGLDDWVLVAHPDHIHEITVRQTWRFHKPRVAQRLWKPFLGDGLLSADGDTWKQQSKMIRPAFHRERIEAYAQAMVGLTEARVEGWREGQPLDIAHEMTELTLAIVARTLFDADVTGDARAVGEAMEVINRVIVEHIHMPLPVPRWWPSERNRRKVDAIDRIQRIVGRIVEERRSSGEDRGDLLSTLILARTDDGEGMTDQQIFDEAMTLFFAGHETTAVSLTWTWYLVATHPEVQGKLVAELEREVGDRPLTVEDLPRLAYLEQVIKESMRFLPSVWTFMREPVEDARIGDHVLPQGCFVILSPYVTGHDARWFPEPEVFRPERWTKDFERSLPKGAYSPFSAGPRVCAGKAFAMMEARLILGTLVQRVHVSIPDDYELVLEPQLSLHPANGMPSVVRLRERPEPARRAAGS